MNFHTKAITEGIIYRYAYGIQEVKEIEELGMFPYSTENIKKLTSIIRNGHYDRADSLEKAKDIFGEGLTLFKFKDQNDRCYYAFYYESIKLGQIPIIIDVFPVSG